MVDAGTPPVDLPSHVGFLQAQLEDAGLRMETERRKLREDAERAAARKQPRPALTQEWLQNELVGLLMDAMAGTPDHQACAKYAEILFKLLPKGGRQNVDPAITAAVTAALDLEATPYSTTAEGSA